MADDLGNVLAGLEERKAKGGDMEFLREGSGLDEIVKFERKDGFKGRKIWVTFKVLKHEIGDTNGDGYVRTFSLPAEGEVSWKRDQMVRDLVALFKEIEPTFTKATPDQQRDIIRSSYSDAQPYTGTKVKRNAYPKKGGTWIIVDWSRA